MSSGKNILLFIFILFFPAISFSQTVNNLDSSEENYKHAVQFYIIDEIIAGYKYNLTENSAIRFIINATGLVEDKDAENIEIREETYDTLVAINNRETIRSRQFFEIKFQYIYQTKIHKIIKLIFGGGPFVNYSFNQTEESYSSQLANSSDIYTNWYKYNDNIWNLGISAIIGVECVVYNNINLFAEYEADISLGWQSNDYYNASSSHYYNNYDYDIKKYELKGLRVGIGISF